MPRRTFLLTIMAAVFLALAATAFAYARRFTVDPSPLAQLGVQPMSAVGALVASGVAALTIAIAAWFRHGWLPWGVACWCVTLGALLRAYQKGVGSAGDPAWLVLFPYVMLALFGWLFVRFAASRL